MPVHRHRRNYRIQPSDQPWRAGLFSIKPTNISVLSDASVAARNYSLMTVLKGQTEVEMLFINSRENFEENKSFLKARTNVENLPAVRKLSFMSDKLLTEGNTAASIDEKFYMDTLQLEESEYNLIRFPQRGVCLYKCGNERVQPYVYAPA